jgi:zinc transporter ZupT
MRFPKRLGDFGILLGKGVSRRNVLLVNLASAAATVVTALGTYWLGHAVHIDTSPLLAIAAGFFIYVAASDLIPDIHEKPQREGDKAGFYAASRGDYNCCCITRSPPRSWRRT